MAAANFTHLFLTRFVATFWLAPPNLTPRFLERLAYAHYVIPLLCYIPAQQGKYRENQANWKHCNFTSWYILCFVELDFQLQWSTSYQQ